MTMLRGERAYNQPPQKGQSRALRRTKAAQVLPRRLHRRISGIALPAIGVPVEAIVQGELDALLEALETVLNVTGFPGI